MKVRVKLFAILRQYLPKEMEVEFAAGATIGNLLDRLFGMAPGMRGELLDENGELKDYVNILKNGRNVHFIRGMETALEEGDVVAIFPPAGGG